MKHFMHGSHFLLRTRRKVRSEVALLFLGYNLKRVAGVLGFWDFMARLEMAAASFSASIHAFCKFLCFNLEKNDFALN